MSETGSNDTLATESEKPVSVADSVEFPPFPEPTNNDFDDDVSAEEREFYKEKYPDLNVVKTMRLHCTACDRHLGSAARNETRMRMHPMLRTLVCNTCHTFYNSGEFDKGDDGSELYCRWCGQGGQVYCCADCPHVFCAKCIKRNFGMPKIKEIENTDDWKCFKCNPKCLWPQRALCWALLRFCDLRNKVAYSCTTSMRELYHKECAIDYSDCCKNKVKRREKEKKKEMDTPTKKVTNAQSPASSTVLPKLPPTIQVKKFASINIDDSVKEKKPQKRPASPKIRQLVPKPTPLPRLLTPLIQPPAPKKMRMPTTTPLINPIRIQKERYNQATYTRIRPKILQPQTPLTSIIMNNQMNGWNNQNHNTMFNNMVTADNINLSLESLTQGLDMNAVAAISQQQQPASLNQDDVVCTPDFPLEPLCDVIEDNTDDDVQCITPDPVVTQKPKTPPLVPRGLPDMLPENIIQMTDNDVTVNTLTGGLKFRVDPQTLSSNKMYRLPDGRIFAINANPSMPGGYSATIVALTESAAGKATPKGSTYAAKLCAVSTSTPSPQSAKTKNKAVSNLTKRITSKPGKAGNTSKERNTSKEKEERNTSKEKVSLDFLKKCDMSVPVEWFRFNLIEATDALEYSLLRLEKLKKEATTMHLRTRSVPEMQDLHRRFDRIIRTSSYRFNEIRDTLNKEMKLYISKKNGSRQSVSDDDDDDVEILNELEDNDDPIFIDENSADSSTVIATKNDCETQEVDLTGPASSEKSLEHDDDTNKDSVDNIHSGHTGKYDDSSNNDKNNSISERRRNKLQIETERKERSACDDENDKCGSNRLNNTNWPQKVAENKISETKHIENDETEIRAVENENLPHEDAENKESETRDSENDETEIKAAENEEIGKKDTENKETEKTKNDGLTDFESNEERISDHKGVKNLQELMDCDEVNEESEVTKTNQSNGEDHDEDNETCEDKNKDSEISEEMIESLLKGDGGIDEIKTQNLNCLEDIQES